MNEVNERIQQRAVIDNTLLRLRMELLLARDEGKRAGVETRQQEYEQKAAQNTH